MFEEHFTDALQEERGKPGKTGGWTGNPILVQGRPRVVKRVCFLFQERVRKRGDARKEKRLATSRKGLGRLWPNKTFGDLYRRKTRTTALGDGFYWGVLG